MKKQIYIVFVILMVLGLIGGVFAFWPFDGGGVTGNVILGKGTLPTTTSSCNDSDGNNESSSGVIRYTFQNRIIYQTDLCNGTSIVEYYCGNKGKNKGNKQAMQKTVKCDCNQDTITAFGEEFISAKCLSDDGGEYPPNICRDSDGGVNASLAGVTIGEDLIAQFINPDFCRDNETLIEFSCGRDNNLVQNRIECKGTAAGKCVTNPITVNGTTYNAGSCLPQERRCSDSDNGINETSAGTVTVVINADGGTRSERDECFDDNKRLREYYCSGITINSTVVTCTDVCSNGVCKTRDVKCTDSDRGQNFTTKGTVTTGFASASDFCINGKTLLELGCTNGGENLVGLSKKFPRIIMKRHDCPRNCRDGACVGAITPAA